MTYAEFEPWFKELRWRNPEAYRKAVAYSESVALKHDLSVEVEADVEQATVLLACELLDVRPPQLVQRKRVVTCPTCNSPDPKKHPAVQFEGEVELCRNEWHEPTAQELEARWAQRSGS